MIPGLNPRDMQKAMKRLGIQQEELDAQEVIIRLKDKELVIQNPSVSKMNAMGQETYQVAGDVVEREISTAPELTADDINTVMEQTGKSKEEVKAAIEKHRGDLAAAILDLQE